MVQQDKSPITTFIGALAGLISMGIINPKYAILGFAVGAFIGYALGKAG